MTKIILISQLIFFFFAGMQIIKYEKQSARSEEASFWIVKFTPMQLSNEKI